MLRRLLPLSCLMLAACASTPGSTSGRHDPGGPPVAEGAQVEKAAGGFAFTEGPAAAPAGNVYFTDQNLTAQSEDRILRWDAATGEVSVLMQSNCGRANGMTFDRQGRLIACADEHTAMWAIDPATKRHTVLFNAYAGKPLNGPNDVWVRPDGGLYFTDPYYQRPWWTRRRPDQDTQAVYFVPAGGGQPIRVIDDFRQPNGIIGTPDGKTLYVADIGAGRTWAYTIQPDGTLADKRPFCDSGSDGMTIDNRGNVYLTSGRAVAIYDPTGRQIARITPPEPPSNVCFGGADGHTLCITARTGFYTIRMNAYGVGSQ